MKRIFAILLAFLMLFGFGMSANAQTQAEGRALLAQTMGDLGGDYTIAGRLSFRETRKDYIGVVHSNGAYAFLREDGVIDIHFADKVVRVYPERNAWHVLSLSYSFKYLPLLTAKQLPENAALTVRGWYESIEVSYEGYGYWYKNNTLWSIDDFSCDVLINTFNKQADSDVFLLEGMREVPAFMQWVWEPLEAFAQFTSEHPMFDSLIGKLLSAGLTVLVIAAMPLLYLVILVLRVLFYFDIYKA